MTTPDFCLVHRNSTEHQLVLISTLAITKSNISSLWIGKLGLRKTEGLNPGHIAGWGRIRITAHDPC